MKYAGAIFDFNGTLFWDTPLHNTAWDIFLEGHGMSLTDEEKRHRIHGKNNSEILEGLFGGALSTKLVAEYALEKELIYQRLCLNTDMALAPGATGLFCFLANAGVPFTIATASGKENLDFYFEHLALDTWFTYEEVVYNDGTLKGKPHPDLFLRAMSRLGIEREGAVVFEDSLLGVEAAEAAGAGRIVIVDSTGANYGSWNYQRIKSFDEVDRGLFFEGSVKAE